MSDSAMGDPLQAVERTAALVEKGPIAMVAAFFTIAFFISLYFLLRTKDKSAATISAMQVEFTKQREVDHKENRDRSIKLELALYGMLDMMDDIRMLAFEVRRTNQLKEQRQQRGKSSSQDLPKVPASDLKKLEP